MGIDLDLFSKMTEDSASPKSVTQLADMTGSDPRLLERFLKHVATADIVRETGPDEYVANDVMKLLAVLEAAGMVVNCHDGLTLVNSKLPEFLKKTGYKNPTDKDISAFKYAANTNLHYFEWIFQLGNTGQDILGFHKAHPNLPGRLIIQDLPATIQSLDTAKLEPVEAMAHDFFTPQPVKGAKAYYMKMVLHDWPDTQCREILSNIKPAMERGHSKILINEIVIPETGADWFATSVDMLMMVTHSAAERRENDWRELLESVGLKIVKIWDRGQ
ncbi:hypothetical protein H2201_007800 [Coniosporium apollinis]|uniref:O-methyltransferase C-terminal domain-containing protein n=2 Tax=Coniosporium TaxID=2810619 RepID=A0ABQ9NIK0_9PEZI|nr:hypothetical protein H2199_003434 [Cladosporium sp. JES 115]KAJ9658360.1 hypothetical protein H2201_007800 [Coniosporium apollinis]